MPQIEHVVGDVDAACAAEAKAIDVSDAGEGQETRT
jgi:hypothetical protein